MHHNYPRREIGTEHLYVFIVVTLEIKRKVTGIFMAVNLH